MAHLKFGGNPMKRAILPVLGVLVLLALVLPASSQEANLSEGRALAIGMQLDYPWGGLVSVRYWFSPAFGAEEVVFVAGDLQGLGGSLTTRVLYRLADTAAVDFYVAAGVSAPFSPYGGEPVVFSAVGGIEFSFAFARNFAWNLEFGGALTATGAVDMSVGTGIHFYF
jgi:hypothetical protein